MRLLQNLSDTALIECLHKGQERAFDTLFYRHKQDVCNVIVHYVRDRAETEDLCQEAFMRIYTAIRRGRYNEQGTFLPWALRIVRNLCMDHLRKAKQFSYVDLAFHHSDYLWTSGDEENRLLKRQQQQKLHAFINRLSDDQKKVVCYRYFKEMSFNEIAACMNSSVNTSLGRMRYGLMHLRREMKNESLSVWQ